MNRLKQLLTAYVNVSYEDLLASSKRSLTKLVPYFEQIKSDFVDGYLLNFMATALAVDGTFTPLEYQFFCDLTGCKKSFDEVLWVIARYHKEEAIALVDAVFDGLQDDAQKKELLNLFLCVCACDEQIASNETKLFLALLD